MIDKIQAGDTFSQKVNYTDYPSSGGWSCSMALRGAGSYTINSTRDGDGFLLSALASVTAEFAAGTYEYAIYVYNSTERHTVSKGKIEVLSNFASISSVYDPRTWAQKTYDAVKAAIQGRATKDQLSYEIAGRKIEKIPIPDLLALYNKLKNEVEQEKTAEKISNGIAVGNKIRLRF